MNNAPFQTSSRVVEQQETEVPEKTRYCLYSRKSSESEERQVLSIDSQVKEMLQTLNAMGWKLLRSGEKATQPRIPGNAPCTTS